jgi:hypothetical protein
VDRQGEAAPQNFRVLGLTPLALLLELLAAQRWRHPGDGVMRKALPWFADPLIFLTTLDYIRFNSQSLELLSDADTLGLPGDKPLPRFRPGEPDAPIP